MATGVQSWLSDADALAKTKLDHELRFQAVNMTQFRGLTKPVKNFGVHKGQSVQITKIMKLSVNSNPISELAATPLQKAVLNTVTVTVDEYGSGVHYTGKLRTLSEIAVDESLKKSLSINQVETMDRVAYQHGFKQGDFMAIPTGTAASPTVTYQTGATPTTAATRHIQLSDIRNIVTTFKKHNIPKYDGAYYLGIFSPTAYARLFEDTQASGTVELYKYDMPEVLVRGEVGSYYGLRIVEETNSLPMTLGTTNYEGEAVFCGFEPVVEALAMPETVRSDSWDLQRQHALGWFCISGFTPLWSKAADNYFSIIRFTSS